MHEISEERIKRDRGIKNINYLKLIIWNESFIIIINKLQMVKLSRINLSWIFFENRNKDRKKLRKLNFINIFQLIEKYSNTYFSILF